MTSIPQTSGAGLAMLYQSLANASSTRAGESASVMATGTLSSDGYGTAPGGGTATLGRRRSSPACQTGRSGRGICPISQRPSPVPM